MAVSDGLVAFFELEEASGIRYDSYGSNHLTDNNTVTQTTGKFGNAAQFTHANSEYLSIAHNSNFAITGSFTIAGWFSFATVGVSYAVLGKWDSSGNFSYLIDQASSKFRFTVSGDGTSSSIAQPANAFGTVSINTLYFVVAWFDVSTGKASISVNDVSDTSALTVGSVFAGTSNFIIGAQGNNIASSALGGVADHVGYWNRLLTSTERTYLYNSGAGRAYSDFMAPLYPQVDETSASDTDFIQSADAPSNDVAKLQLTSLSTPDTGDVTLRVRSKARY